MTSEIGVVFSGQGKLRPEALKGIRYIQPDVTRTFADIDAAAGQRLRSYLPHLQHEKRSAALLRELTRDETAFLIYGISVAAFRTLTRTGWSPRFLFGQSFGEFPALVCSGAFTTSEGALLVAARQQALATVPPNIGAMATLAAGAVVTQPILTEVGGVLGIAVENSCHETVISGTADAVERAIRIAARKKIRASKLTSAWALHCAPLLEGAARDFRRRTTNIRGKLPTITVFSPVLGRFVGHDDDLVDVLALLLTKPILFRRALQDCPVASGAIIDCSPLEGARRFVEVATAGGFWHLCTEPDLASGLVGRYVASVALAG